MQALNCLIIEDEPLAASLLQEYIALVPGLQLAGTCEDAFQALEKLRTLKVDLLFLDINLPRLSGLDFLRSLPAPCPVILTTAYHQYALEGYTLNVVDYLLKPIEFSRFLQAVNKVFDRLPAPPVPAAAPTERRYYYFNVDKKQVKVYTDEILYFESLKDYLRVHTATRSLLTRQPISGLESILQDPRFLRVHKSFAVNRDHVTAFNATDIELGSLLIPIGRTYREMVEKALREVR